MFNADGSEAEMCGNGIRCVAKYVFDHGIAKESPLKIETGAGVLALDLETAGGKVSRVRVDMGKPVLEASRIPVSMKGLAWSVENPKGALDIFLKSAPTTNRKVAEAIWRLTVDHLLTPESKKLGIGHMTREKWERTLAVVKQTSQETINVKAADLYTNEFLPKLFPKVP